MSDKTGPWIKIIPPAEAGPELREALQSQGSLYPEEYKIPIATLADVHEAGASIVMSHSLIPAALKHAFSTFGSLMSPDLPLSRRQHEMIAAAVSSANTCFY